MSVEKNQDLWSRIILISHLNLLKKLSSHKSNNKPSDKIQLKLIDYK